MKRSILESSRSWRLLWSSHCEMVEKQGSGGNGKGGYAGELALSSLHCQGLVCHPGATHPI